jgi:hypothetical protein
MLDQDCELQNRIMQQNAFHDGFAQPGHAFGEPGGTWSLWRGGSANPERFTLYYPIGIFSSISWQRTERLSRHSARSLAAETCYRRLIDSLLPFFPHVRTARSWTRSSRSLVWWRNLDLRALFEDEVRFRPRNYMRRKCVIDYPGLAVNT